jgi:hypothetical protein
MKKLIFAFAFLTTLAAFAQNDCVSTYREGYLDLKNVALEFNSGLINRFETASEVTFISGAVATQAKVCSIAAANDRTERVCVSDYKSLYSRLRNNISTLKITTGSQKEIVFGSVSTSSEDEGVFGRVLREGLSFGTRQVQRGELAIIDARCL